LQPLASRSASFRCLTVTAAEVVSVLTAEAGVHYKPGLDVCRSVRHVKARRATGTRTGIRRDGLAASGRWLLRKRCSGCAGIGQSRAGS
jgi:hypothetical protein